MPVVLTLLMKPLSTVGCPLLVALCVLGTVPGLASELDNRFPIMAWDAPPNDSTVLVRMRECGFTLAGFVPLSMLDACHAAGLKAIVSDPRTRDYDWRAVDADSAQTRVRSLIEEARDHPAVFGYYLRDEPPAGFFPGLTIVSKLVKELHPGAWPYINLFPNYASPDQLECASYDEYLELFVEVCRPPILSYDHYALTEDGKLQPGYFANLETVRRSAIAHELPFWNIVLAASHFNFREITAVDFRFQAYTSLAYGARGIGYFKYFTPARGNYRAGPIDQFGNETPTWYAMQATNLQIDKLGPTLLQLTSDRVYHFGEIPPGCRGPDEKCLVRNVGGPVLVGDFTHTDGTRYVFIVNKGFEQSVVCAPEFNVPVASIELVSAYSGQLAPFTGEEVWLAPGQGALLKLTP